MGKIFIKFFNLNFYFLHAATTFGFSSFCHYWNLTSLIVVLLRLRVYVKFSLHCIWHAIDIHSPFRLFSLHFWFFSIKYILTKLSGKSLLNAKKVFTASISHAVCLLGLKNFFCPKKTRAKKMISSSLTPQKHSSFL